MRADGARIERGSRLWLHWDGATNGKTGVLHIVVEDLAVVASGEEVLVLCSPREGKNVGLMAMKDDERNSLLLSGDIDKHVANVDFAVVASTSEVSALVAREGKCIDAGAVAAEGVARKELRLVDVKLEGRMSTAKRLG